MLNVIFAPSLVHLLLLVLLQIRVFTITGSGANVVISGGVCGVCTTGVHITNNAITAINGVSFRINAADIVQDGASRLTLASSTFEITNSPTDI